MLFLIRMWFITQLPEQPATPHVSIHEHACTCFRIDAFLQPLLQRRACGRRYISAGQQCLGTHVYRACSEVRKSTQA